jgi:LmbE family N-acetylglucosaminyl deacetylase
LPHTVSYLFAHPDDESFLCSALSRELVDRGHPPALLLATRGDAGNNNGSNSHLTQDELAKVREAEMEQAAAILGIAEIEHLGLPDGKLQEADYESFLERAADFIDRMQAAVIVTFPEDGGNLHPDHIAISRIATAAILSGRCPSVQKLYYVFSNTLREEGIKPAVELDTERHWPIKAEALRAHKSQILAVERYFGKLDTFPETRRYESFALAWERGAGWPVKRESSVLDDLV